MSILNKHPATFTTGITMALTGLLLAGCSIIQPAKTPSITSYALDVQFESAPSREDGPTLLVNTPNAQSGLNSTRMIYIKRAHEIDYFSLHQWVDTPARMLTPLLVQALEHTSRYRAVIHSRSAAKADLRLDSEITRFQHEFLAKPSQVHLTARVQLIDIQEKRVIATREFDVIETAPSEDAYGGVIAANRAAKTMLLQIADFCTQQVTSVQPGDKE